MVRVLRFAFDRYCAFNQYSCLIMDHFHKSALDREKCKVIAFILQDLYLSGLQRAHQRGVSIENFEQAVHSGQLYAVDIGAEQFLFGS